MDYTIECVGDDEDRRKVRMREFHALCYLLADGSVLVDAVDDILCREGDNRTIGLLLCKSKDRIKAEYALRDIQKPIGISDYELGQALPKDYRGSLPTIEEIEKELEFNGQ